MKEFANVRIAFCGESNLANEAEHIAIYLRNNVTPRLRPVLYLMYEDHNGTAAGIRTSNDLKKTAYLTLNRLLLNRQVRTYERQVTVSQGTTATGVRDNLIEELEKYARIIEPSKKPGEPPKEFFTGKLTHATDDLAIAMQLNPVVYACYMKRQSGGGGGGQRA